MCRWSVVGAAQGSDAEVNTQLPDYWSHVGNQPVIVARFSNQAIVCPGKKWSEVKYPDIKGGKKSHCRILLLQIF